MLIRFNVKNFLSFDTRDDGKIKLLKLAAVYGANASGKSNLVKAMNFMKHTIIRGLPDGHTEKYCKVNPLNKDNISYFELEIMLNGRYYAYGFEVILSQSKFMSEWLVELRSDNSEKDIFTRNIEEGTYTIGNDLKQKGWFARQKIILEVM